ncbi:hypothetical protein RvY_12292 [Ramazzottius varieornatus]|uniref:ZP domain-containing protein n=1 Tax=Ramazzottius varieornatus TaxID=947166 RepID=A0A1D1VRM6_RAMVA|nr:hypothetical protein RvY_12292 [Ramazzottius varieornatus]
MKFLALVAFSAVCLNVATAKASRSQRIRLPSISRSVANDKYEFLTLKENDQCAGNRACPADASGELRWQYAQHNYGGSIKVTYKADGTVNINIRDNESLNGPQLARTTVVIGNGGTVPGPCHLVVDGPALFDRTFAQLAGCGIVTVLEKQMAYREFDLHVHQRFQAGDEANVHLWGGRIIKVRLYREISDPVDAEPIVPEFPLVDGADLHSCSALTHTMTTSPTNSTNQQSFTVSTANYDPTFTGIGFQLQTCTLTSYWKNGSLAIEEQQTIIANGDWMADADHLLGYSETVPGQSYTITMDRVRPLLTTDELDIRRPALLSCSVCLCKVRRTGVAEFSDVNDCAVGIDIVDPDRPQKSSVTKFRIDNTVQFDAGPVYVVKDVGHKLRRRGKAF